MKIYKYELSIESNQTLTMPRGSKILSIQLQQERLYLWAIVNNQNDAKERRFTIVGTGHEFNLSGLRYISTVQQRGGALVWHIFEASQ